MTEGLANVIERLEATVGTDRDPRGRAFAPVAELLRTDGRLVEARVRVEAGVEADPAFASGHMVAARIYADLGLDDLARTAADRVLALDPANEEASALAVALDSASEELALEWARAQGEAPVVAPVDGELLTVTMGDLYLSQGASERAVALFERMLAEDPENEVLRSRLEEAQGALGLEGVAAADAPSLGDSPVATVEAEPVAIEMLAPTEVEEPPRRSAPVAVTDLAPDAVSVHELAPRIVGVESLAPDRSDPADGADPGVDDFMAWLEDQ